MMWAKLKAIPLARIPFLTKIFLVIRHEINSLKGINYLYQRRSVILWLIDGFYIVFGLGIAGIILGAWK